MVFSANTVAVVSKRTYLVEAGCREGGRGDDRKPSGVEKEQCDVMEVM